nr:MAG TPA: tail tube protein [Caudoviricetes sp.]
MPAFDLRYLQVAEYKKKTTGEGTEYGTPVSMGDAMTAALDMRFAEGRLYAESALAEYMKKATGGTATAGVKYIPLAAQKLMFRAYEQQRTVSGSAVKSVTFGKKSTGQYVGWSFYAPDMIDGVEKFTAIFVRKVLFGPPAANYQTLGDNITFQTPTTTGEFLIDDLAGLLEVATLDTEEEAKAWCDAVFTTEPTDVSGG